MSRRTYWLTRFVVLRLVGLVYLAAFVSAALQVAPLLGHDGLLPVDLFLARVARRAGSRAAGFEMLPSLFWVDASDRVLAAGAWAGAALALVVAAGFANAILMATLWALYMSYVHVGQDWYGYGWEIQLLETGFLAVFLCPLFDARPFPRLAPPAAIVWCLRWLAFRIMLGAGLIKLRGDPCWRDLTCLDFHYETQPIPNPLSRAFHRLPHWVNAAGVAVNHAAEMGAPWMLAGPRAARLLAGALMLFFQLMLIASGNLSFLNWLTIVPILAAFDDAALARVLPARLVAAAARAAEHATPSVAHERMAWGVAALIAVLSLNPVANLLSGHQVMNTSFDRLDLVNTYGAFGTVGRVRHEIVFEGTGAATPDDAADWRAYEFPCKPGDPRRRPCIVSPFQPRLAWQLWFAAMSTPDRYPWTLHLVAKLLAGDPAILGLVESNPFPDTPPRWIRARYYRYRFAPPGAPDGAWWQRTAEGLWLPPLASGDPRLLEFLAARGWASRSTPKPEIGTTPPR